jgi:tetratricopeptide (TPR) repeat protein
VGHHRTLVTTASVALFVAAVSLATAAVLLARANARERNAKELAEQRRDEVDRERRTADHQRDRARSHYERAFAAVDRMLTRVGEKELVAVPYMDETRRRLLEDALNIYRDFLRDESNDPAVRREIGQAHGRIARVQHLLGSSDQAEEAWGHAIDLQLELAAEFADDPAYQLDLARSRRGLAVLQHLRGCGQDAERTLSQLVEDQARLTRKYPKLAAARVEYFEDLLQLGVVYHMIRRPDDAEAMYGRALELAEALNLDEPGNPDYQEGRSRSLVKIAQLCRENSQRLLDAERHYAAACGILERLVADHEANPDYRSSLAAAEGNLANVLSARGRRPEAEAAFRRALDRLTRLADEHPDMPGYKMSLAKAYNNVGLFYANGDDLARAVEANRTALKYHEELMRRDPKRLEFAINYAGSCGNQAKYLNDQGKPKESLEWYEKTIDTLSGKPALEQRDAYARLVLFGAHLGRASAYLKLNLPREATKDWRCAVELSEGERHFNYVFYRPRALAYLGEHARAASEAEAIVSAGGLQNSAYKELAGVYSVCSAAVRDDASLIQTVRHDSAERYAARAVALLVEAGKRRVFRSPAQVAALRTDEKFRPLEGRDDFRKLLAELEQESKAGPK